LAKSVRWGRVDRRGVDVVRHAEPRLAADPATHNMVVQVATTGLCRKKFDAAARIAAK
jgi:hypothetical protein